MTFRGHIEIVKMLVQKDSDLLNIQDEDGQTALHYGASCSHVDIVKYLLEAGADPSICDSDGQPPCNEDTEAVVAQLFRLKVE